MQPGDRTLLPKIEVGLEVRDENGRLVEKKTEAANLATENWIDVMEGLHTFTPKSQQARVVLTDDGGVDLDYTIVGDASIFVDTGKGTPNSVGPRIAIGDGGGSSVTPARGNHQLDNQLDRKDGDTPSSGSDSVTISATFTNNTGSSFTVRETAMFMELFSTDDDAYHEVLMYHDAVSATSVADSNSVTVTYTFTWP
jgi:hypothetical protein